MKSVLPAIGVCLIAGVLVALWLGPENSPAGSVATPVPADKVGSGASMDLPAVAIPESQPDNPLPPLPPELRGLEPETRLTVDTEGNLVPSIDLRVLLDFYLANIDQEPLETVLLRIRSSLGNQLQQPALDQALSLLSRYVGYRMALEQWQQELPPGVTSDGLDLSALQQRQSLLEQLQHEHFSRAEKSAFFDDDTLVDNFTLERLAIEQDNTLTDAQKSQRLEQLKHQLPESVRLARERAVVHGEIYQQAEALKTANASDGEIYQMRAEKLGEEAALQLADLDRQQRQWQQRLSDYRQEKARIQQAGLSEPDRESAIDSLREKLFSAGEQLRVRALEGEWR